MKRQLGTALSVIGLLAIGTAAAAVNVRMLHGASSESAQFQMHGVGDFSPLGYGSAVTHTANGQPRVRPGWGDSSTVGAHPGPGGIGFGPGPGDGDGDHPGFGAPDPNRPPLTAGQMNLLRVAAMVRVEPMAVRAVAKGDNTDPALLASVKSAAKAVGVTMRELAAVADLPPRQDRGHGGPGHGHHGEFVFDSATATLTYDD